MRGGARFGFLVDGDVQAAGVHGEADRQAVRLAGGIDRGEGGGAVALQVGALRG
ncbi:MAG: hypothetical protein U0531_20275 [Dehalococcoidia bacterium]